MEGGGGREGGKRREKGGLFSLHEGGPFVFIVPTGSC